MPLLSRIKHLYTQYRQRETEPEAAYDQWAVQYDDQPGNLMLALDEELFNGFCHETPIKDKIIADIGCGTGRHWNKILQRNPRQLMGFDVSREMLAVLRSKFPDTKTTHLTDNRLPGLADHSCDLIISTLTIAHIKEIKEALQEWDRVLKPGGTIFITDYHPDALARGGNRTFKHQDKTIAVRNHIHPIEKLRSIAKELNLQVSHFTDRKIDESVKWYYENKNALALFHKFNGTPIIYSLSLKKMDGTS